MNRRGFLGRLAAIPAALYTVNARPVDAPTVQLPQTLYSASGNQYRYFQANKTLKTGDVVCFEDGEIAGISCSDCPPGNYGWMQISNVPVVSCDPYGRG